MCNGDFSGIYKFLKLFITGLSFYVIYFVSFSLFKKFQNTFNIASINHNEYKKDFISLTVLFLFSIVVFVLYIYVNNNNKKQKILLSINDTCYCDNVVVKINEINIC